MRMDPSELFAGLDREEQQRDEVVSRDVGGRSGADVGEAGIDAVVGEDPLHQDPVDIVLLSQLLIRHLDEILVRSL